MIGRFEHEFVEFIPPVLEEGKLYVSIPYATAVHLCASGCGQKVVTPLSPTDWRLVYDGVDVSIAPSIGNWNFDCQSHYWIRDGNVVWDQQWSRKMIKMNRKHDRAAKGAYYERAPIDDARHERKTPVSWIRRSLNWFRRR